jgi:hypothetical protein
MATVNKSVPTVNILPATVNKSVPTVNKSGATVNILPKP